MTRTYRGAPTISKGEGKMKIEIGKTYKTRDGTLLVTIEAETDHPRYRMQGEDNLGRITWRSRTGRFSRYAGPLDLVAEV